MTDAPEPGNTSSGPASPSPAPKPAAQAHKPAPKPRKPGSGQHRKKVVEDPAIAERAAAAKAAALARRQAEAETAAKARAAALRRAKRRRAGWVSGVAIAVVLIAVAVLVVIRVSHKPSDPFGKGTSAADPTVVSQITSIPKGVLDQVADGGITPQFNLPAGKPAALTLSNLPRVVYVGALYCPFCATERWPMIGALARFGSFTGLKFQVSASAGEAFKDIHTFDFSGVTYTSQYLAFTPKETEDRAHKTIAQMDSTEALLFSTYDSPPTLPQGSSATTIPFIDLGNKWVLSGASFPANLVVGKSWRQLASAAATGSGVGQQIDGTINWLTAALCTLTQGQPASVCSDPMVTTLQARLPVGG
ncbi:MAG TPA: DUF929 family protein [Actinomycetota bacterium]|nr:DUF929 family protein [Actinomycetota bacterium]